MFCCKKKCDLDITKFRKSNPDNDCFIHLLKNCLEHYNALKDRVVSLEKQNIKYKRKLKKRSSNDSDSMPKEIAEAENINQNLTMDELKISSEDDDMQVDEFDQNISENDVFSTYDLVKNPAADKFEKSCIVKKDPETSKNPKEKRSEKSKISVPSPAFPKPKEKQCERILKPKSLIQPTLSYFQKDKSSSKNLSMDRTFCKELDIEMDKSNVENIEVVPAKKLMMSPKTKQSFALIKSKGNTQKDTGNLPNSVDAFGNQANNNTERHNDKFVKIKTEKSLSLNFASNIQNNTKSKINTSVLFDTEGDVLSNSVIILENENHKQPIIIDDDTVVNNSENNLLEINSSIVQLPQEAIESKTRVDKKPDTQKEPVQKAGSYDCRECDAYYQYLLKHYGPDEMSKRIILCSKHNKPARPETPEGFWNVAFTPSP